MGQINTVARRMRFTDLELERGFKTDWFCFLQHRPVCTIGLSSRAAASRLPKEHVLTSSKSDQPRQKCVVACPNRTNGKVSIVGTCSGPI